MDSEQLIAWLQKHPKRKIFLSTDAEGNMYSPLDEPTVGLVPKGTGNTRTEEVFEEKDLVDEFDPDEAVLDDFDEVIVFYPL